MDQLKVAAFLEQNKDYLFPNKNFNDYDVSNALLAAPDEFGMYMDSIPFRNPSLLQIIAFFPGSLGVDRFYLGDKQKGILKFFTFGGFGIWWIKDILSAKDRCRAYNCQQLMDALHNPSIIGQMQKTDDTIHKVAATARAVAPVAKELFKGAKDVGKTFYVDE